jgi:hypothetical protein
LEEGTLEEEGTLIARWTCCGQIALRTVSAESYNIDSELCARVSPSELPTARVLHFSRFGNL